MLPKTYIANYEREQSPRSRAAVSPMEEAENWINGRIRQAENKLLPIVEIISPARAKALLERNESNRSVNKRKIRTTVSDIREGRWQVNGETIIVADDGMLNDGQHRLMAIVDAGESVESLVVWGAPRESRMTVDCGSRDADDYLTMRGVPNGSIVGVVAKLDMIFSSGAYWENSFSSSAVAITDHAMGMLGEIQNAIKFCRRKTASDLGTQGSIIFSYMVVKRHVGEKANEFFNSFLDGAGNNWWVGSPAFVLRKRFMDDRINGVRKSHSEKIEHILRSWNFHVERKKTVRSIPTVNSYPEIKR